MATKKNETKSILVSILTSNPSYCSVADLCRDYTAIVGCRIPFEEMGFPSLEAYLRSMPEILKLKGSGPDARIEEVAGLKSSHIQHMVASQNNQKVPFYKRKRPTSNRKSYTQPQLKEGRNTNRGINNERIFSKELEFNDTLNIGDNFVEEDLKLSFSHSSNYSAIVPESVQSNLKELILKFPVGILSTDLPNEYRKMFNKQLKYEKYNFRSLVDLCANLPEIFNYVPAGRDDFILYNKKFPIPIIENKTKQVPQEPEDDKQSVLLDIPKLDWFVFPNIIPSDVLYSGEKIPRVLSFHKSKLFDVGFGEIIDLSKFWVYELFGPLNPLMKELQLFMNYNIDKYQMPEALLRDGLYCIATYIGKFHRAVIVDLLPKQEGCVQVFFVDYGTVDIVFSNEIWYLPRQFAELPCQATRARLSSLCPKYENHVWSVSSINRFIDFVSNTELVAEVIEIDETVLELYIANIEDKNKIFYVNDRLVKEDFALYTHQERINSVLDLKCRPCVKYLHLFPLFYEHEEGNYLLTADMNYIVQNKIPVHWYMNQYFDLILPYENFKAMDKTHEEFNRFNFTFPQIPEDLPEYEMDPLFCPQEKRKLTPLKNVETEHNESVREYPCNKKRISDLINREHQKILEESPDNASITSVNSSLNSPTNPFLTIETNPFRVLNPFVDDIENTVKNNVLLKTFAKSSDNSNIETIHNNLNSSSSSCTCKANKVVNVGNPHQMGESSARIRTPPGFSSRTNTQNLHWNNEAHYNSQFQYPNPGNMYNQSNFMGNPLWNNWLRQNHPPERCFNMQCLQNALQLFYSAQQEATAFNNSLLRK